MNATFPLSEPSRFDEGLRSARTRGLFPPPGRLRLQVATPRQREMIYQLRHEVYAQELGQHPLNSYSRLTDALATRTARVTIQATLPVASSYTGLLAPQDVNMRVARLNEALRSHALKRNYGFLDFTKAMSENGFLRSDYTIDGLHLSLEAYRVWLGALQVNLRDDPVAR